MGMNVSRGKLADVLPGPELAASLATVDRSTLDGDGQADLLLARSRLLAWVQAELLDDVYMVARDVLTDPASRAEAKGHEDKLDLVSSQLVGWTLHWSRNYAYGEVTVARALVERLPAVREALHAGRIDEAKAAAIVHALSIVDDDELARRIADRVLRNTSRWTLSQLRDSLRYHVDRADPANARRRYQKKVAGRNVYLTAQPDGTANLGGVGLPPHRAAQAYDRLDRIARTARTARAAGDGRNLAQLRADALTDILAGVPFRLAPTVAPVSAEADAAAEPGPEAQAPGWRTPADPRHSDPDREHRDDPWPRGLTPPEEEPTGRIDLHDYDRLCLTDEDLAWVGQDYQPCGAAGDEQEQPPWWTTATPAPRRSGQSPDSRFQTGNPDAMLSPEVLAGDQCVCSGVLPDLRPGALDVQVKLTTLIGRDDHPALIAGFGPILADLARQAAHDPVTKPVWTWSIFDDTGDLLHHRTTTHRPPRPGAQSRFETGKTDEPRCTCPRIEPGHRRGTVDLQLTFETLATLMADPPPGYEALIADIATQAVADATMNPPGKWSQTDANGRLLNHGHTARMPNATEDAFIRTRDRTCRAPGCLVPASRTDIDHRIPHSEGGPAHRGNGQCLCHPHHLVFRHRFGFTVAKTGTTTTWTIPNGLTFEVRIDDDIILTAEYDDHA